jgi:hypothetical protein
MLDELKNDHALRKHAYSDENGKIRGVFNEACDLCQALKNTTNLSGNTLEILVKDEIPIKSIFGG